ncbi:MAG: acyl--CoA ligase [Chloroflexi bacterium]|nr:acyl--CoA ligase [Chloroflexota bacterium]
MPSVPPKLVEQYVAAGYWDTQSIAQRIAAHAACNPGEVAFVESGERLTWAEYDLQSSSLAGGLRDTGLQPGERLGIMLPDGPGVHVAYVAAEKAGLIVVGIGPRAGEREIRHLLTNAGATALLSEAEHRGRSMVGLAASMGIRHISADVVLSGAKDLAHSGGPDVSSPRLLSITEALGPNDVFLLNSTSGTTGLPKQVLQFQNRWVAFHHLAVHAGALTPEDVFMALPPAPYGFGLWTAHITPTVLGAKTVLMSRFGAEACLELIERERVTVLACVSTQFIMLLNSPDLHRRDVSSLRCMFTGGEAVPYERAAEFEERFGAAVLQFYGSNETGALSYTRLDDTRDQRLRTCGRIIPQQQVRLFDDDGGDVTANGGPGQPACKGPLTCLGYYNDSAANAELFTEDGWMFTGDIATISPDSYLSLIGRKSDFIIRGGKNVSAPAVEEEIATHPAVAMAAAVSMPDPVFGERVCAYVVLRSGAYLTLAELATHLDERGVSKEMWPERLIIVDALPTASGGKVAKAELRADIRKRLAAESTTA